MESKSLALHNRVTLDQWADLPPELVEIISGGIRNPNDLTRFRSLCRSWRLLTCPPPPYKISPFFPLTISFSRNRFPPITLLASAVYLLRPRGDPSKAWMVYVQETGVGKLVLRHALTYEKIAGSPGNSLDLLEWSVTEIARSCGYNRICEKCNQIETTEKVDFVSNFSCGGYGVSIRHRKSQAVALYKDHWRIYRCRFRLGVGNTIARQLSHDNSCEIEDSVNFNGQRLYAIDSAGCVYVVHNNNLRLLRIESRHHGDVSSKSYQKRFVVSDGDLYVVLRFRREFENPPECQIYKIVMEDETCWEWERVENLGDRVFFIVRDCSFSVPARDLPHPWKGNCVVVDHNVHREAYPFCGCFPSDKEIEVFHLGDQQPVPQFSLLSSLGGYSDLFTPPPSWINQSCREI